MSELIKIINELYESNFNIIKKSAVSSSHWNKYTEKLSVTKTKNDYIIASYGLANFINKNIYSSIKSIPRKFFLFYLFFIYIKNIKIFQNISKVCNQTNILIEFDQIKHGIILKILKKYINFYKNKFICIIGDGHGFCGSLIKKHYPESKIIFINLGRNLFLDAYYVNKSFNSTNSLLLDKDKKKFSNINNYDFIFINAENFELISELPIYLFINIASMQEMDNDTISKYFYYIRKNPNTEYFYSCNRIRKILPDSTSVIFDKYPWLPNDKVLVEEICNWYKKYPISRYPFLKNFDGLIKHKLIKLK
mgnify:CR=1 FL=1